MKSIRARVDELHELLGGDGCPTCKWLAAAPSFYESDGVTPYPGNPPDECPTCGGPIRHAGKIYVGIDPARL